MFFTHIVRADYKPSRKDLLRFMARGAAVSCRRNEKGVDIIIPVLLSDQSGVTPEAIPEATDLIPEYPLDVTDQAEAALPTHTATAAASGGSTSQTQQQGVAKPSVIRIDPSRVSLILVQVKNYESEGSDGRDKARNHLRPSNCIDEAKSNETRGNTVEPSQAPYVGIWMQAANIKGQVAGVKGIPMVVGVETRNTKPEENMLGLFTDGVGTRTFPFLDELPSMREASQGMHAWILLVSRVLAEQGGVDCRGSTASAAEGHPALHARSAPGPHGSREDCGQEDHGP